MKRDYKENINKLKSLKKGDVFILSYYMGKKVIYRKVCLFEGIVRKNDNISVNYILIGYLYKNEDYPHETVYEKNTITISENNYTSFSNYDVTLDGNKLDKYAHLLI